MQFTDVRPSGGYQGEKESIGVIETLRLSREPWRSMFPGEFLHLINKHKHPRWFTASVLSSRWGAKPRKEVGISPQGTVYFADAQSREDVFAIPCDCIPYTSIRTAHWREDISKWSDGELVRGWRPALESLLTQGYLYPHEELSFLIGKDSKGASPRKFWE